MIYLILSASFDMDDQSKFTKILKIGYTEDRRFSLRMADYKNHNPSCKILNTIPQGDRQDETNLHGYFRKYRVFNKEWYEYNEEIIDFFKTHTTKESLSELPYVPHYKDKISDRQRIIKSIEESCDSNETLDQDIRDFLLDEFMTYPGFAGKFKAVYDNFDGSKRETILNLIPKEYKYYAEALGIDRCRALGFKKIDLDKELKNKFEVDFSQLEKEIYEEFPIGGRFSKSEIKSKLSGIYKKYSYSSTAKAVDLEKYFEIRYCQISNKETGKRDAGFEIIKKK